jgi:hypothetical protein
VPTFDRTPTFNSDLQKLTPQQRDLFRSAIADKFVPDLRSGQFRAGLRVKGVQGEAGVFEMTWADDGRATFRYGNEVNEGEAHIVWLRVGTHDIF